MRFSFIISVLITVFGFAMFSAQQAQAQGHSLYCSQADSTAATQNCLKKHLDTAQRRLNRIYKKLNNKLEDKKKTELAELQKSWLTYRDAECMWEAKNSETTSLKRINELSCMARVSEDRANILSVLYDDEENLDGVREYGSFPRWMNAAAKDNSGTYWNYGGRTGMDLDCDGEDEYVMSGIQITQLKMDKTEEGEEQIPQNYNMNIIIALAQNPPIGRPVIQTFKFLVNADKNEDNICSDKISMKFIAAQPVKKISEEDNVEESCSAKLEVKSSGCDAKYIAWTGKEFSLEVQEVESTAKE